MSTLKVREAEPSTGVDTALAPSTAFAPTVKHTVRIEGAREAVSAVDLDGLSDSDVLELELEDGVRIWTSVERFRNDAGQSEAARDLEGGALPLYYPTRAVSRGERGLAIKVLKVLGVDLADEATDKIAAGIEDRLDLGVHAWRSSGELVASEIEPTDEPILVFLHGTASSTAGSFGDLTRPEQKDSWSRLQRLYDGRIYALEHRTLTESPIENALQLVERLPEKARVHVVSHSRGGLVGELLCHGRIKDQEGRLPLPKSLIAGYARGGDGPRAAQRKALGELNERLAEKRPRVERFVRVACPAKGTTLASKRLDLYLSGIVNLLGLIPGFKGNPVYGMVSDLLLAVAKNRTDPAELPGLEAMMPSAPLIHLLNTSGLTLDADLSVIAGDSEGAGLLGRLKVLLADAFYLEDHDLVVNSRSMERGARRASTPRRYFTSGPRVDHFSYFRNPDTVERLMAGLTRRADDDAGFEPVRATRGFPAPVSRGASDEAPVVFVLPGIMGSGLAVQGNRYWMDVSDIAKGRFASLKMGARVTPTEPLERAYGDLIGFLGASHEVHPFAYDWRLSIQEAAELLGRRVQKALDDSERPVRILAHSMGGLVARMMIAQAPDTWAGITSREGGRLVMLGTPNGGSYVIPRVLTGREKVIKQLAMIDLRHDKSELIEFVAAFPGMMELLPAPVAASSDAPDGEPLDLLQESAWKAISEVEGGKWSPPEKSALERARATREQLDRVAFDPDYMLYVAGVAESTPVGLKITGSGKKRRLEFEATRRGDGRVPWETGIPDKVRTWYMLAKHGQLAAHQQSFHALQELLDTGETSRLLSTPPITRSMDQLHTLEEDEVYVFPDEDELTGAALGYEPTVATEVEELPLKISVAHGNLKFAYAAVMVGHYKNDAIVSAEAALDRKLDGRLTARHQLGLYPGPIATAEVLFSSDCVRDPHGGAIVVGLGDVGQLTPGRLTKTVENGAVRYALAAKEAGRTFADGSVRLSSLLIGSGEGGVTLQSAVESVVRGILSANERLGRRSDEEVRISELEFIELFQDQSLLALEALERIDSAADVKSFVLRSDLQQLNGGRRRTSYGEPQGWWTRLTIESDPPGEIEFTTLGGRARAGAFRVKTQAGLIDELIERAIRNTAALSQDLTSTLFELLVPSELKGSAADQRDLVLVMDDASARYPWEMLLDRSERTSVPLGAAAGLLRQLKTPDPEPVTHSYEPVALVVGDPPSELAPLPGAVDEAQLVVRNLRRGGWEVATQIRHQEEVTASSVTRALMSRDYRVLHLAGHGVYDPADVMSTGMVLDYRFSKDRKEVIKKVLLTPNEVSQMRTVPEFVFINCCHLGRQERLALEDPHGLASNLASQFIKRGVRAVIAAGWAVDDGAAMTFARTFYQRMLDGETFGRAVLAARRTAFNSHPHVNTWGAYQCYGDPGYRLVLRRPRSSSRPWKFHDPAEAVAHLENQAAAAKTADTRGRLRSCRSAIAGIRDAAAKLGWTGRPDVAAALGMAYGEAEMFKEAVEFLEVARDAEVGSSTLTHHERLANYRARWGADRDAKHPRSKARALIRRSLSELQRLSEIAPTSQRHSLLGSGYKRLAWLEERPESRQRALTRMAQHYCQAADIAETFYALENAIAAVLLLGGPWKSASQARQKLPDNRFAERDRFVVELERLERGQTAKFENARDFWTAASRPDLRIVRGIFERSLHRSVDDIAADYQAVKKRIGGSQREWASVIDQVEINIAVLSGVTGHSRTVRALRKLCAELERLQPED